MSKLQREILWFFKRQGGAMPFGPHAFSASKRRRLPSGGGWVYQLRDELDRDPFFGVVSYTSFARARLGLQRKGYLETGVSGFRVATESIEFYRDDRGHSRIAHEGETYFDNTKFILLTRRGWDWIKANPEPLSDGTTQAVLSRMGRPIEREG